jgi:arylsulfatase A-like enzyme
MVASVFFLVVFLHINWLSKGSAESEKPFNILFILVDQLRQDALGCYGNAAARTPHVDWLAKQGVRFSNVYSSTPSCTPARAAILTGLSPWYHGMLGYGEMAPRYPLELPRFLSDSAGYYTHVIGKNHYGWDKTTNKGISRGFQGEDIYEGLPGVKDDYYKWFSNLKPNVDPLGATGIGYSDYRGRPYALPEGYHPTSWVGQRTVDFLKEYKKETPFFLKVSFHRPHCPYDPPGRLMSKFTLKNIPNPYISDTWDVDCKVKRPLNDYELCCGELDSRTTSVTRLAYYASVSHVDEWVGRILSTLHEQSMWENTVILFTSDHGDMLGDHYRWRKILPYESSAKIPLLLYWPLKHKSIYGANSIMPSRNIQLNEVVELRDLFPTFVDVACVAQPNTLNGSSLLNLLRGRPSVPWREYIDMEHSPSGNITFNWNALTDGKVKYIYRAYFGDEQIFDLRYDPNEMNDLSDIPEWKNEVLFWRARLIEQFKQEQRGPDWLRNGKLTVRTKGIDYSPHFPCAEDIAKLLSAQPLSTKLSDSGKAAEDITHKDNSDSPSDAQKAIQHKGATQSQLNVDVEGDTEQHGKDQSQHISEQEDQETLSDQLPTKDLSQLHREESSASSLDSDHQLQDKEQQVSDNLQKEEKQPYPLQEKQKEVQEDLDSYQQDNLKYHVFVNDRSSQLQAIYALIITCCILSCIFVGRISKVYMRSLNGIWRRFWT